jgi:hypothetical protein
MESLNQDVGQIHSDSQYDPATLPADGRQLMSDVRAAQADQPPKDKSDYRTYLSALANLALMEESGNGDGPLTLQAWQNAQQTNQAITGFGNMLACHGIALDGVMGSCNTPGSGSGDAAPSQPPSSADTPGSDESAAAPSQPPSSADTSGDEEQAQSDLQAVQGISFSADLAALNADARTSVNDGRKARADFHAYLAACAPAGESAPEAASMQAAFDNDETKMFDSMGTPASDDTRATNDATRLQEDINAAGSQVTAVQDDMATLHSEGADLPSGAQAAITAAHNAVSQAVTTANADIDQVNQADDQVLKLPDSPTCPLGPGGEGYYLPGPGIPHVTG